MRSTGVVRKLDELGRIVLPMELRRTMGIEKGDGLEIFVDGEYILLRKYAPGCVFCGEAEDLVAFYGKMVCGKCRKELGDGILESWKQLKRAR